MGKESQEYFYREFSEMEEHGKLVQKWSRLILDVFMYYVMKSDKMWKSMMRDVFSLLDVLVEDDASLVLYELAGWVWAVERSDQRRLVLHVIRAKDFSDTFSSFLGVVEGHFWEKVVAHVCVGDVVECVV